MQIPWEAIGIWQAYVEISGHRGSGGGFGPSPISWLDIDAWTRVTGSTLSAHERGWVFELDVLYLERITAEMDKKTARAKARAKR